jgi:hypothetical protein
MDPPPPPTESSTRKTNLRGAGKTEEPTTPGRSERTWVEREIKVDITTLGNAKSYPGWRLATEVAIGTSNVDPDLADIFIEEMNTLPMEDLATHEGLPKELRMLDSKIYAGVTKAIKDEQHTEHQNNIKAKCKRNHGRHAIRILDKAFDYKVETIADEAASEVIRMKCKDPKDVGRFVAAFSLRMAQLEAGNTPLHPRFGMGLIKTAIQDLSDAHVTATVAEFEARPLEKKNMEDLLRALEKYSIEARKKATKKDDKYALSAAAKKAAFAGNKKNIQNKVDANGNFLCNYCGKGGHLIRECRKKAADEAAGRPAPKTAAAFAHPKKKAQNSPNDKKTFPECPWCKKTNHDSKKCFFGPGGKFYKGAPVDGGGGSTSSSGPAPATGAAAVQGTLVTGQPTSIEALLVSALANKLKGGNVMIITTKALVGSKQAPKKWILDCGASDHVVNPRFAEKVRAAENPALMLTADGWKPIGQESDVRITHIPDSKSAVVAPK